MPHEPHPFKWYVPDGARFLFIGTFPPVKKRWAYEFFYPNARNLFWKILAGIRGIPVSDDPGEAVSARRELLHFFNAGITDMGGIIRRTAENSLDENLELIEYMPVLRILDEHPSISRLLLTSSSGRVSALAWLRLYLLQHGITFIVPKGPKPLQFSFEHAGREIEVHVLFSPSPRASNRISSTALMDMYRRALDR